MHAKSSKNDHTNIVNIVEVREDDEYISDSIPLSFVRVRLSQRLERMRPKTDANLLLDSPTFGGFHVLHFV